MYLIHQGAVMMSIRRSSLSLLTGLFFVVLGRPAVAQMAPVQNPANGHWYQVVPAPSGRATWPNFSRVTAFLPNESSAARTPDVPMSRPMADRPATTPTFRKRHLPAPHRCTREGAVSRKDRRRARLP